MGCITPMIRYYQNTKLLSGREQKYLKDNNIKLNARIIPRNEVLERLEKNENLLRGLQRLNEKNRNNGSIWQYQAIPCGHCYACKLKYSAEWATRIMLECQKSKYNYFITFTYNEQSLPIPEWTEYDGNKYENDGTWNGTLYPYDITKFLNSLRQELKRKGHTGLKYFYAGEYCPSSGRPHYHMILMNCPLDINKFYGFKNDLKTKKTHWKSRQIDNLWKKGFVDIAEVEFASAAYVARYCMKKITDDTNKSVYYKQGKLPEFVRMSRRPGIGAEYFNTHIDKLLRDESIPMKNFHGETISYKMPKAWDKKIKELYPEAWELIKESREESAKRAQELMKELTDYTDYEQLEQKANNIIAKASLLTRNLEYNYDNKGNECYN